MSAIFCIFMNIFTILINYPCFILQTSTHTPNTHTHKEKYEECYDHLEFIPGEKTNKTLSHSGLCCHGYSDMCTWLSKALDIQAPLTESHNHHHHHHHHSTVQQAEPALTHEGVVKVTMEHKMGVVVVTCMSKYSRGHAQAAIRSQRAARQVWALLTDLRGTADRP